MPENQTSGYGKRPLWQWVLIYLIIGGAIYGLIYYFIIAKKGGYSVNYNQQGQSPTQQESSPTQAPSTTTNSNSAPSDNIYKTKDDASKGKYLTDFNGMTLYVFDKDTTGVSNCYNACETAWPPYTSGAASETNLPANITIVKRTNGTQFAWRGKPLYYYALDKKSGDTLGDGFNGIWHLVKP